MALPKLDSLLKYTFGETRSEVLRLARLALSDPDRPCYAARAIRVPRVPPPPERRDETG